MGRVLGPDRRNLTTSHITHDRISPDMRHHISPHHTLQAERREHKEEVLGPSSWAGWLTTPHHISDIHISSHAHLITPHHTSHIHISPHQTPQRRSSASFFMRTPFKSIPEERKVRELPRKMNIEEVEAPKHQKSTSFIVKTLFKSIPEQRKVRELPRKMNIEEVEEPKKYENYHAKPVSDPFKSIAEHRKVR